MDVSLTHELEQFVESKVGGGGYADAAEVVRSALLARTVIDRSVAQAQLAEAGGGRQSENSHQSIGSQIRQFVDDYCGTGPHRWPLPWPGPLEHDSAELHFLDLLVAGAQFHKAAGSVGEGPLRADFSAAADRLVEAGLNRMENG